MLVRPSSIHPGFPRILVAASAALLAAALLAAPAFAAAPLESLDVRLITDAGGGEPLLLVSGTLPQSTPLPAELSLRVPAGSRVVWAGEILGESAEEDSKLDPRVEKGERYDVVTLTLTRSHEGQVEVATPGMVSGDASGRTAQVAYDLAAPVPIVRAAVAVPPGSRVTSATPALKTASTADGFTYYYLERRDAAAGDVLTVAVSFVSRATTAAVAPALAERDGGVLLPLLVLGVAIGAPALALLARRTKGHAVPGDPSEPPSDADASGTRHNGRWRLVVVIAVVGLIGAFVYAAVGGGEPAVGVMRNDNGVFSQRVSTAEASSKTRFQVTIACECPPETEAPKMFAALATVPGVADASLQSSSMVMEIGFDASVADAQAISAALAAADYSPSPVP